MQSARGQQEENDRDRGAGRKSGLNEALVGGDAQEKGARD